MLTKNGPRVIEYNSRFGDPETQVVLPLLESDLLEIMRACTNGTLDKVPVHFKHKAAACVIMASSGYPGDYEKGFAIYGISEAEKEPYITVYCAGVGEINNSLVTAGGRVLGVSAVGETLPDALNRAYTAVEAIYFDGAHYRRDIGGAALSGGARYGL
jgi:phosphoribosylamine--glycine ligase